MDVDVLGLVPHVPRDVLDPRDIDLELPAVRAPAHLPVGVTDRGVLETVDVGLVDDNGVVVADFDVLEVIPCGAVVVLAGGAAENGQGCYQQSACEFHCGSFCFGLLLLLVYA